MLNRRPWMAVILLALFLPTACFGPGWKRFDPAPPREIDDATVVDFLYQGATVRLHGVHLTRDSISGIPWLEHLTCDTCRVSYPLAGTSAMRTGDPGSGGWNIVVPFASFILLVVFIASQWKGD